jgi:hypothetical protein
MTIKSQECVEFRIFAVVKLKQLFLANYLKIQIIFYVTPLSVTKYHDLLLDVLSGLTRFFLEYTL